MIRPRTLPMLAVAAAVTWSTTARAYSPITTDRSRWPGNPAVINYQINPGFASAAAGTRDQQDATIRAAAASWNATGLVDMRATRGTTATVANDGINAIFVSPMASGNALATTFVWSNSGQIVEFDMVFFEGDFEFAIPANLSNANFDIQSIALHELGHALGLGHSHGRSLSTAQWATWSTYAAMKDHVGDFNGDHKTDILKFDVSGSSPSAGGIWVGLSTGGAFDTTQWDTWATYPYMQEHIGDFNGDGKDDVMKFDVPASGQAAGGLWVGLSDGTRFNTTQWDTWTTYQDMKTLVGDFNGDHKADVMKFDVPSSGQAAGGLWVGLSNGTRFNTTQWATWTTYKDMKVLVGDFDGDGKDDVMKFDVPASGQAAGGLWVGRSDGTRFNTTQWATWTTYKDMKVLVGDFNHDGKDDVMKFDVPSSGRASGGLWVGLSTGTGFNTTQWETWTTYKDMKVLVGDFNGDRLADVMKFDVPPSGSASQGLWIAQSTGTRFFSTGDGDTVGFGDTAAGNDTDMWSCWLTNREIKTQVGDFNGDGVDDVLKFDVPASGQAAGGVWVGLSRDEANPVMFPSIGTNTINRTLDFDESNALGCYYR